MCSIHSICVKRWAMYANLNMLLEAFFLKKIQSWDKFHIWSIIYEVGKLWVFFLSLHLQFWYRLEAKKQGLTFIQAKARITTFDFSICFSISLLKCCCSFFLCGEKLYNTILFPGAGENVCSQIFSVVFFKDLTTITAVIHMLIFLIFTKEKRQSKGSTSGHLFPNVCGEITSKKQGNDE